MKNFIEKVESKLSNIYSRLFLMASGLMLMPFSGSYADGDRVDLMNTTISTDGKLDIPGAGTAVNSVEGTANAFNDIYDILRVVVAGLSGILSITMVIIFIYKAFTLARVGDNPNERAKTIQGMIFFFIGAACFGGASLFVGLFYNMLR